MKYNFNSKLSFIEIEFERYKFFYFNEHFIDSVPGALAVLMLGMPLHEKAQQVLVIIAMINKQQKRLAYQLFKPNC